MAVLDYNLLGCISYYRLSNFWGYNFKMKQYFINGFEVHENTYKQYLDKEFTRVQSACKCFNKAIYKCHSKVILNDILFEEKEDYEQNGAE